MSNIVDPGSNHETDVVIIGASRVIGLPVSLLCLYKNATVTITHIHTKNLDEKTKNADIVTILFLN